MSQAALYLSLLVVIGCASTNRAISANSLRSDSFKTCSQDEARQKERSVELQKIVAADQKDREDFQRWTPTQAMEVLARDLERRKRVGEIFGEGCFKSAADFSAAALVYQHGDTPDHFYQTFIWSKRAVELGDSKQNNLLALGLDRYLVNTGRKQLFASQAHHGSNETCFCLQPVEKSFLDSDRVKYTNRSLAEALKWVDSLNVGKSCAPARECDEVLQPTPSGSIPGFW